MDTSRVIAAPASLAKGALRRLAQAQLEPTPENYARAYAEAAGQPVPAAMPDARAQGAAWVAVVERLARNLERGGRVWTGARRKESLKRLFDGSRSDAQRLLPRLQSLISAWESDQPEEPDLDGGADAAAGAAPAADADADADATSWPPLVAALEGTVRAGLPADEPRAADLATRLGALAAEVAAAGVSAARVAAIEAVCAQARRLFTQRHRLVDELGELCRQLGGGLADVAEDESWVHGQCLALQACLDEGLSVRSVRAAGGLLAETRAQQQRVRGERLAARQALRQLIRDMLVEVGEIGAHAGRFELATAQHAEAIAAADTLESLAGVVKAMLENTRGVQAAVALTHQRLQADHDHASELEVKVRELESELRRLAEEVSTDALTQVANRRGLAQAFETEVARCERGGGTAGALAVGLIDIDNFKRLNDNLGHAAGDVALQRLAAAVRDRLRPVDHLARFGGEEFVVLLPGTELAEAQQALTRLQRSLSEALFLHDGREVFVTFSAGVTAWRGGEVLQATLERADEALYEAKRAGKNRTCVA
jgi:diguanylate cyclase